MKTPSFSFFLTPALLFQGDIDGMDGESGEEEVGSAYDYKTQTGLSHRRDVLSLGTFRCSQKCAAGNHCTGEP